MWRTSGDEMFEDEGEPGVLCGLCKTSILPHNISLKVHFIKITTVEQSQDIWDKSIWKSYSSIWRIFGLLKILKI